MTVTAYDLEQLINLIEGFTIRGLGFRADAAKLTITLTGAH